MKPFMRYLVSMIGICLLVGAALPLAAQDDDPTPTQPALPDLDLATNTPRPPAAPTALNLATNTPPGPSDTPSPSPSPTLTPTHTLTPSPTSTPTHTPTPTFTPSNTPTPTPTPIGPFSYPEGINPLTGLPYPNAAALQRRNLLVKISNFPPLVRPQSGVNAADVVYEYEVEGGVTRFAGIYRSTAPEEVGPIRSGRLMDIELVTMYEALFAYSGASGPVQELILSQDWRYQIISPSIGDNCAEAGFCRDETRNVPFEHTLFADTSKIWERAEERGVNDGYQARGFAFDATPDPNGVPANDVFVNWYGQTEARWQYDEETYRYQRHTDGLPHLDATTDEQLWANNLVIIEVEHLERPDLFDAGASNASLEIDLNDQGRAILVRDGQAYQGFWRRRDDNPGSALQLVYGDNTPMKMRPGRTWVSVVRGLGNTTISEQRVDVMGTAQAVEAAATPTPTLTLTPASEG